MKTVLRTTLALVALGTGPAAYAQAGVVSDILNFGGALIINDAIRRQQAQQQRATPVSPRTNAVDQANLQTRAQRMEVQRRLNLLGFNAGTPDGIFGSNTRRAISAFQASLGSAATGYITENEVASLYQATEQAGAVSYNAPGQNGTGFVSPILGGATSPSGAAAPAFPALGVAPAPGGQPAAGFPQLGSAPQPGAPAPVSTFPALGGGQGVGTAPQVAAFPQLGVSPTAPVGTTAFPSLGANAAQPQAPAGAFPALGREGLVQGSPAPTFPALGASNSGETPAVAFPELGGVADVPLADFPALRPTDGVVAEQISVPLNVDPATRVADLLADKTPADFSLISSLAGTPYLTKDSLPKILGISLGDSGEAAVALLEDEGFPDCSIEEGSSLFSCLRVSEGVQETITLATGADGTLWHASRVITFDAPVDNALLSQQMSGSYPELVAQGRVAPDSCTDALYTRSSETAWLFVADAEDLSVLSRSPESVEAVIACPTAFELMMDGPEKSTTIAISFTDAGSHLRRVLQQDADQRAAEASQMQEVVGGLKF